MVLWKLKREQNQQEDEQEDEILFTRWNIWKSNSRESHLDSFYSKKEKPTVRQFRTIKTRGATVRHLVKKQKAHSKTAN